MNTARLLCTLVLCTMGSAIADEFQANVRTTGNQCNPALALTADGGVVLVWSSYYSSSGRSNEIMACYFDPNGSPASDEFQINAIRAGNQTEPALAIDSMDFLYVVWQGPGIDGDEDIFARLLTPAGDPVMEEFVVNTNVTGRQVYPSVATSPNGAFVVVWESESPTESGARTAICGLRFDANSAPIGQELGLDGSTYDCRYPDVAADARGNFTVTWLQDRTNKTIRARQFDANGVPVADAFDVSIADITSMTRPSIAMTLNGEFVIVWDGDPNRADSDDIHARCFTDDGTPRTDPFLVNALRDGPQQWPQVAIADANEFTVVWQHEHDDPNLATDIFARTFDLDGQPVDEETKLNGYVAGKQRYPEVAMSPDGSLVAAWESDEQDGSGYGIFAWIQPPATVTDPNAEETID